MVYSYLRPEPVVYHHKIILTQMYVIDLDLYIFHASSHFDRDLVFRAIFLCVRSAFFTKWG